MIPGFRDGNISFESDNSIVVNIFDPITLSICQSRHVMNFFNRPSVHKCIWATTIWYHSGNMPRMIIFMS